VNNAHFTYGHGKTSTYEHSKTVVKLV